MGGIEQNYKKKKQRSDGERRGTDKEQTRGKQGECGEINKQGSFMCCLVLWGSVRSVGLSEEPRWIMGCFRGGYLN